MYRLSGSVCSYANCRKSRRRYPDLNMFRFPKSKERREQWLENCGNESLRKLSTKAILNREVCADHFDENVFFPGRKRVFKTAVPKPFKKSDKNQTDSKVEPEKNVKYRCFAYEDVVLPQVAIVDVQPAPPKKKHKLTHRKSSDDHDITLVKNVKTGNDIFDLECAVEELEPCQKAKREKINKEETQINSKINGIVENEKHQMIYMGEYAQIVEIEKQLQALVTSVPQSTNIILQTPSNTVSSANTTVPTQSYQLVMDPRLGIVVGTVPNAATPTQAPPLQLIPAKVPPLTSTSTTSSPSTTMQTRRGTVLKQIPSSAVTPQIKAAVQNTKVSPAGAAKQLQVKPVGKLQIQKQAPKTTPPTQTIRRTTIATSNQTLQSIQKIGGLTVKQHKPVVDLTNDANADSREILFNKLQGTTYPSLVVIARPHLKVKDLTVDRPKLDAKVKSVLMYSPTKFTEWLIQQGLVKSDQKCKKHPQNAMKLGMFSDATKFPHSGGYVWISECCVSDFAQVFDGSIFENCPHPPMAILKLIYHWCCQTIVQNVTQWVKVDNTYVKTIYTWLRSVCTVATHTHIKQLGGPGIKVQVGLISLGTSQNQNQKQVKVEVLGVMEIQSGSIRLRAIKPVPEFERNYRKRFSKILEPMVGWVHPSSIIITDMTVDKSTLNSMGFAHVYQSTVNDGPNTNGAIMDYLRRVVPRMFQNTLGHLSHQLIQQFLDELVWREWFGNTVLQCFDNIVQHLSEQTRYDTSQSLIARLNAVSLNPFGNWAIPLTATAPKVNEQVGTKRYSRTSTISNKKATATSSAKTVIPLSASPPPSQENSRSTKDRSPDIPEQMVPLESYYYGTIILSKQRHQPVKINMKCPYCKSAYFNDNLSLMEHLFKHAHNVTDNAILCRYCLALVITGGDLTKHIATCHPEETKFDNSFMCLICEQRFMNPHILGKHMSSEHCPSELPYACGTCNYRCSNHKQAVDHFYVQHKNSSTIQCPFCLKSVIIHSGQRNVNQNVNYFVQHLQKHQKKSLAKKCAKCNLWFVQKEFMKEHQTKMHLSQRGKYGLVPATTPRVCIMVPKSKSDKCPDDAKIINFSALKFNVNGLLLCKECSKPMNSMKHFSSFESCQNSNCQYTTCCANAMKKHVTSSCKILSTQIPEEKLPYEMFCVCGYSNFDGNQMAKHLAICERKSAYPSLLAAQGATANNSMLDVLGLVRKPEEKSEFSDQNDETKKSDDDDIDKSSFKENTAEEKKGEGKDEETTNKTGTKNDEQERKEQIEKADDLQNVNPIEIISMDTDETEVI